MAWNFKIVMVLENISSGSFFFIYYQES